MPSAIDDIWAQLKRDNAPKKKVTEGNNGVPVVRKVQAVVGSSGNKVTDGDASKGPARSAAAAAQQQKVSGGGMHCTQGGERVGACVESVLAFMLA